MTVWLIHGWWTRGEKLEKLGHSLRARGYTVRLLRYGKHFWRWKLNKAVFDALSAVLSHHSDWQDGDVIVAHSNGANIAHKAMRLGLQPSQCIWLSPALDEDIATDDYGPGVGPIHVWHTTREWATWFAKWVPSSEWGAMGKYGYQGADPRFINRNWAPQIRSHSGWFKDVDRLASDIHEELTRVRQPPAAHA